MSGVVADLHVHTTRSDGTTDPAELGPLAAEAGLAAVAITDHDRLPPWDAPHRVDGGVTVLSGIELRVDAGPAGRVDLLAYGIRATAALESAIAAIQADRVDRAREMRGLLEAALDVAIPLEAAPGVGRPHLARAVAAATDLTYQAVFDRYIGADGPCYVKRRVPAFDEGHRLLADAGGLVVLAHPLRYDDPAAALALTDRLDGVEVHYPYPPGTDRAPLDAAVRDASLVRTGGSDAHEPGHIGRCGLDARAYRAVARALGLPMD